MKKAQTFPYPYLAKDFCTNVGQYLPDHFPDVKKMIELGSGAFWNVDDILLAHYMKRTNLKFLVKNECYIAKIL